MKKYIPAFLALLLTLSLCGGIAAAATTTTYVDDADSLLAAIADSSPDITLSRNIVLSGDININYQVNIHGAGKPLTTTSDYNVSVANNVAFDNLSVTGAAPAAGAVVVSGGTVNFDDVSFNSISAGRAVVISSGTVNFEPSVSFSNNTAGAVEITGGSVTFDSTTFSGNGNATMDGGAVAISGTGRAEFVNVSFSSNNAQNGGAVSVKTTKNVSFKGTATIFNGNTAGENGGAVSLTDGGSASFEGAAEFNSNTATQNGGAVYSEGANFELNSSMTFSRNTAGIDGGAVWTDRRLEIPGGVFTSNEAANKGGAVYASGALEITGGTFESNTSQRKGGAVCASDDITISSGDFTGNSTSPTQASQQADGGGAVYSFKNVEITGGKFSSNKAKGFGGAVWGDTITVAPSAANVSIRFEKNEVTGDANVASKGGALFSNSIRSGALTSMSLRDAVFVGNKSLAAGGAGGAAASLGTMTIANCVFGEDGSGEGANVAESSGGAVYSEYVTVRESTFIRNVADEYGGAVYVSGGPAGGGSSFNITLFTGNISSIEGGAGYSGGGHDITFLRSYFDANYSSGKEGGAIHTEGNRFVVNQCTFFGNYVNDGADSAGGAIWTNAVSSRIVNSTFVENSAGSGSGGAVYLGPKVEDSSIIFYSTLFNNAAGGGRGGALFSRAVNATIGASLFVDNVAGSGLDIYREIGILHSVGYSIIKNYGISGASGQPNPNYNWAADPSVTGNRYLDKYGNEYTARSVFGTNDLANNPVDGTSIDVGSDHRPKRFLETVALADSTESSINPALDQIAGDAARNLFQTYFPGSSHTDQRGYARPNDADGFSDIGAFESESGTPGGPYPPGPVTGSIAFVRMSGIPLTMKTVGQTCSLTAVVYYQNGTHSFNEKVSWQSTNPSVATIDQYGNMYSYSRGSTKIIVTTERPAANGQPASDSADLVIENDMMNYMNIFPGIRQRMGAFNSRLQDRGVQLYFLDSDPAELRQSSFSSQFLSAYGVEGFQIEAISDDHDPQFITSARGGRGAAELKPSAGISMKTLKSAGGLVQLRYTYNLTSEETSAILGRTLETVQESDIVELFDDVSVEFVDEKGESRTVMGGGTGGIQVSDAISGKALSYDLTNSLRLQFDVLMGDAEHTGRQPEYMIGDKIVLADNSANGNINGQLSLVTDKSISVGGDGSGSGSGGGGCSGGAAPMALALLTAAFAAYAVRSRK